MDTKKAGLSLEWNPSHLKYPKLHMLACALRLQPIKGRTRDSYTISPSAALLGARQDRAKERQGKSMFLLQIFRQCFLQFKLAER